MFNHHQKGIQGWKDTLFAVLDRPACGRGLDEVPLAGRRFSEPEYRDCPLPGADHATSCIAPIQARRALFNR